MPNIFIDTTDIAKYIEADVPLSGIQRVVFEIIKNAAKFEKQGNVYLSYYNTQKNAYLCIPASHIQDIEVFDPAALRQVYGIKIRKTATAGDFFIPGLQKYENKPLKYKFHSMKLKWAAWRKNEKMLYKYGTSLQAWGAKNARTVDASKEHSPHVSSQNVSDILESGDIICIMGATWDMPVLNDILTQYRQEGAKISLLLYDLIPIVLPEVFFSTIIANFNDWLYNTLNYCDQYLSISEYTAQDMRKFMGENERDIPIKVIPLAQQLHVPGTVKNHDEGTIAHKLAVMEKVKTEISSVTRYPYVLCVGTMESRKNNWALAQAWARMITSSDRLPPRLVFAGKKGWMNDDFFNWMKASGNLNGWVTIVEKPTDYELEYLYKNCEFTAFPSLYEGWGLPIGESLSYGKTAVVGDNSSLPEVGGDLVEYCDASSVDSIVAACRRLIDDPDHKRALETKISETQLRTWDDVVEDFIRAIL